MTRPCSRFRRGHSFVLALLWPALLSACWGTDVPQQDMPIPGCENDGQCPNGLNCLFATCVSGTSPSWPIRLRFLPSGQALAAAAEVGPVEFGDAGPLRDLGTIRLSRAERLVLRVRTEDGEQLAVRASARAVSTLGAPLVYSGENLEDLTDPRLSLQIPRAWPTTAGSLRPVIYDLVVMPKNEEQYPPWVEPGFRVPDVGSAAEILLPATDARATLDGQILLSEDNPSPVAGMSVFVVDGNGHTISSRTSSDENGRFILFFWARSEAEVGSLRIVRTVHSGPLPDLVQSIQVPTEGESAMMPSFLGVVSPIMEVEGEVVSRSETSSTVPGVSLRFSARVGEGVYRIDVATTDGGGRFDVPLYPGTYEVDLIPHSGSIYRVTHRTISVEDTRPLSLILEKKVPVRGRVTGPDGLPIALARVTTQLRASSMDDGGLGSGLPPRVHHGQTALDGSFALQVDAGVHVLRVEPDPRTGLPSSQHLVTIPEVETEVEVGTFAIPAGAVLDTLLLGPDDAPAIGIVVEAWRETRGAGQRVGWAVSDELGRVRLRLPSAD